MASKARRRMDGSAKSATYRKILDYINSEPRLLGTLYDLNLLPEVVQDDPDERRCMLACYFGYRVGKDCVFWNDPPEKKHGVADGR